MSSDQLDELRETEFTEYVAQELGITVDELEQVLEQTVEDEYGTELTVYFWRDAPVEILNKVRGLREGQLSIRIEAPLLDWHPDDWDDTGSVENPKSEFDSNYWNLTYLLGVVESDAFPARAHSLQLQLIFKGAFTALEAYLGDTIQNQVEADDSVLRRLVLGNRDLKDMKFSLPDLISNECLLQTTVKKYLQGILYHKFESVEWLYRVAFDIDIWTNKDAKDFLFNARSVRHDYTHRNGRKEDGSPSEEINVTLAKKTLETVRLMVEHIHGQLHIKKSIGL